MKQSGIDFFVGVFVVIGLAAVGYLTIKLGAGTLLGGDTYDIEARFDNVSGLNIGSNVVVAGVTVGRVQGIRVDSEDYSAIVDLRVTRGLNLPSDSMASIKTTGLIGDKYILLAPGAEEDFLSPNERIVMTESSVDIESLIGKMAFGKVEEASDPNPHP